MQESKDRVDRLEERLSHAEHRLAIVESLAKDNTRSVRDLTQALAHADLWPPK